MKKLLYTAAMMLMVSMVLTSCFGVPKFPDKQKKVDQTPIQKQVAVTYTINCSQDLLDAADLVITIHKNQVGFATDTIRDTHWTKTIVDDVVPYHTDMSWWIYPKEKNKINNDTLAELFAEYTIKFEEPDSIFDRGGILHYRNLPVSQLEGACELSSNRYVYAWNHWILPSHTITFDEKENRPEAVPFFKDPA